MTLAHAQETAVNVGVNMNAFDAIMSASLIVQLTLLSLVILSLLSWGIIFAKKKQFDLVEKADEEFQKAFWDARSWDDINQKINTYENSPLANIFRSGFQELQKIAESGLAESSNNGDKSPPRLAGMDNVVRALRKASDLEIAQFESRMTILATTGSTSPFIGLFGTVWGIMTAFQKIGATGAAHLAVVAPGISEALIATAVGLFVAIPAVIAYNHFLSRLKKAEIELNNFISDFANIAKRNFFKGE